ncbi:MAG: hypothetical protein U0990_11330 [Candidatus Nanopelagicales bacterium]|nr:hypothetical protein [Candidatus Nanopelagicales bacterium]MDZ4250660.1 hypothetical protein [Candidatus Nanopelagicales bacterium]MDZ7578204.1 hypothetical protein [Candidatus Nanopelagicales bacterium]
MRTRNRVMPIAAAAVLGSSLALAGCSSDNATPTSSPTTSAPSPSPTTSGARKEIGDWELVLTPGSAVPAGWPASISAPAQGTVVATGTGSPIDTASDHPILAVEYTAPGQTAAVMAAQVKDLTKNGWKPSKSGTSAYKMFLKPNQYPKGFDSLSVAVQAASEGVSVYQWT